MRFLLVFPGLKYKPCVTRTVRLDRNMCGNPARVCESWVLDSTADLSFTLRFGKSESSSRLLHQSQHPYSRILGRAETIVPGTGAGTGMRQNTRPFTRPFHESARHGMAHQTFVLPSRWRSRRAVGWVAWAAGLPDQTATTVLP